MATTKLSDIINPQVMADMISAKVEALAKITPYAKVDTTLQGVPGDTITVPMWKYAGDADDFEADGEKEAEASKLVADTTSFTIKCAIKVISILQKAINSGLGDPVGQAESQLAKAIAGKIDTDLINAAYASKNIYNGIATEIGYAGVVGSSVKFEDEEDGIEKVMFIHPLQEEALLNDENFKSADKFDKSVIVTGAIGKIGSCWVKKSKKVRLVTFEKDGSGDVQITESNLAEYQKKVDPSVTLTTSDKVKAVTTPYYACPVLKIQPDSAETEFTEDELPALTIFLKEDTEVSPEWLPKKQRHDITATKYYGAAMTNEAKVVIAHFKAPTPVV